MIPMQISDPYYFAIGMPGTVRNDRRVTSEIDTGVTHKTVSPSIYYWVKIQPHGHPFIKIPIGAHKFLSYLSFDSMR